MKAHEIRENDKVEGGGGGGKKQRCAIIDPENDTLSGRTSLYRKHMGVPPGVDKGHTNCLLWHSQQDTAILDMHLPIPISHRTAFRATEIRQKVLI